MQRLCLIAWVASLLLAGCGGASGDESSRQVVTSFYPLEYAAKELGETSATVTNLTPPGAEPHDIELTARDVARIQDADVVLYLGSGFQPAVEDAVAGAHGTTVDLLDGVRLRSASDAETRADPHIWLDPVLYADVATRIGRTLGEREPARALTARLRRLDADFRDGLSNCERREIVTSHAAFGYLAARYRLSQVSIAGISPEAEPTPGSLKAAVHRVRRSGATTVFFETLVSPRVAETVARETGARTAVLDPIEGLTEEEAARGDDYFTVMRRNLTALRSALRCR